MKNRKATWIGALVTANLLLVACFTYWQLNVKGIAPSKVESSSTYATRAHLTAADAPSLDMLSGATLNFTDGSTLALGKPVKSATFAAPWGFGDLRFIVVRDVTSDYGVTPPTPIVDPIVDPVKMIPAGRLMYVGVLENVNEQTDEQGAIETSTLLLSQLEAKGNIKRWVDPINGPSALAFVIERAKADGLPRSVIVDWGDKSVKASEAMADEAKTIALVKKWGGE
jgi:hypothetical protein